MQEFRKMFTTQSIMKKIVEEMKRGSEDTPQKIEKDKPLVAKERSQLYLAVWEVKPKKGSLLAVGLALGVIDHTGIYVGGGYVIEQHGNDALKKVTLEEFMRGDNELHARGVNFNIQIACDNTGTPLAKKRVAKKAIEFYEDYERRNKKYSIVFNNCHQFCWECIAPKSDEKLLFFSTLEELIAHHYGYVVYWDKVRV